MGARDPDEFSADRWPGWSFWKGQPDSPGARGRGRVVVATATAPASLTLIARAVDIAHSTRPPLLTWLAIGLVATVAVMFLLAGRRRPCFSRRRTT